jgi:hypothetical protein
MGINITQKIVAFTIEITYVPHTSHVHDHDVIPVSHTFQAEDNVPDGNHIMVMHMRIHQ